MLLRIEQDRVLAIGQLSHAWLSGQLARAWGNERFSPAEPYEEVVLGAQQHDIGWALFDRDPGFNPDSGLPRSFLELSVEEHLAIWRDAPERLSSQSLHAALVVSLHGRSLSELRLQGAPEQADALREHIEAERARQARLCAVLGVAEEQLQRTRRQMWTWDGLSLALCHGWRPFLARDVPTRDGLIDVELRDRAEGASTLDPWPFATKHVELRVEARALQPRYPDERTARQALASAEALTLAFALASP